MKKILLGMAAVVLGAMVMMSGRAAAPGGAPPAIAAASQQEPLRIFLRGGPKTHGPADNGQHDGPTWLKEWKPLLEARGATVDGALKFPTAEQLEKTDVLVMFTADGGKIQGEQRDYFLKFLKRGGGVCCFHDSVVTPDDPQWFKTIVGGAWENNVARYFEGENTYYYVNAEHPVTKGASNFKITDEVYWQLHMMPEAQILASAMQPAGRGRAAATGDAEPIGKLIPQIWVYENQIEGGVKYRAFVDLLGHHFTTFSSPHARAIFLRGIAWAGKRDADLLTTPDEVAGLK
ncbi:MAG TPA: ThuA domain-containing protein [Phycisphaerae bacterium]|nr:ThuA domain-containing protein [Phycisphaerae bacterium]